MDRLTLTEIVTKDGIVHQGLFQKPVPAGTTAILWIHGLTGNFYGDLKIFSEMMNAGQQYGIGLAAFNNRGHDMISGLRIRDKNSPTGFSHADGGAGREVFQECIFDIDAGICFLADLGYTKIILAGHSTGANKVCYWAGLRNDPRVTGIVLAGPLSDRLGEIKTNPKFREQLHFMKRKIEEGEGDMLYHGFMFFPITPKRYVSLFETGSAEDVFDYGETKPKLSLFSKIRQPLLLVFSENDEYADRSVNAIKNVFDARAKTTKYKSIVIRKTTHGYEGKEAEFAQEIISWIKDI